MVIACINKFPCSALNAEVCMDHVFGGPHKMQLMILMSVAQVHVLIPYIIGGSDEEDYFERDDDEDAAREAPAEAKASTSDAPQTNGVITIAEPLHALPGLGALQEYGDDDDDDGEDENSNGMGMLSSACRNQLSRFLS